MTMQLDEEHLKSPQRAEDRFTEKEAPSGAFIEDLSYGFVY